MSWGEQGEVGVGRYDSGHKEATRQRLIDCAGRRFKEAGFDGAGIAALVGDAGLTNGAFYGHFTSKDDLIATVVAQQLGHSAAHIESLPDGVDSTRAFLRSYLSTGHRDDVAGGCPSAALLDEIPRRDHVTRVAYTEGVQSIVAAIAARLDPTDPSAGIDRALGIYAVLVASLQIARAVTDPDLSERVLASAYENALALAMAQHAVDVSPDQKNQVAR